MTQQVAIMNTIRVNASDYYRERVPQATQDSIESVGNAILSYQHTMNEFLDSLVNKIALTIISTKMAENKLKIFKRGFMDYGKDVEEIFTNMATAHDFNQERAESEIFKRVKPDVRAIFHRENRRDFYKVTISEDMLRKAFRSQNGLGSLLADIVSSMYSGDEFDEYVLMKELISKYKPNYRDIVIPEITDEKTAKDFVKAVRQSSLDMSFMSNKNNAQGVMTRSNATEQVLFLHKDISVHVDVDVLAWAFNSSKVNFDTQVVILDDFGTMEDTYAVLTDKNWFMVWDTNYKSSSAYNNEGLYWNYWVHHWQILSTSQFQNAVRFTTETVTP